MSSRPISPTAWRSTPTLLRCEVHTLGNGARVIDCGVNVPGGYDAGLALSEICMGGLGNIALGPVAIGERVVAGPDGVDRSPDGQLHGIAVRRLGHLAGRFLRDGVGSAARACAGGEGALRQARLCGDGGARRARARGAAAAHGGRGGVGRRQGEAVAQPADLPHRTHREPRRRRADRRARGRDGDAQDRDSCTSTCRGS